MNILSDTYIFYMDVYFLQNVLIKMAVIYLAVYCNKLHVFLMGKGLLKVLAAALIGTAFEILGLYFGNSYQFFLILIHIFEIPCMISFVLGKEPKKKGRVMITGYFFVIIINGVLEVTWNCFGTFGNYVIMLCASCVVVYVGLRIYLNYNKMQKGIYAIEILHQGKKIAAYGLYDSGNRLRDPYTQKGVHIVSEQVLKRLGVITVQKDEAESTSVYIPYQALGNENGILKVYYVDEVIIDGEKERIHIQKCPLGVTNENLFRESFKESKYEIILNEEVF